MEDRDSIITAVAGTDSEASEIVPAARDTVPVVAEPGPLDRHPAAVYLASKASAVGRRGLRRSLDRAAELLTGGETNNCLLLDWPERRYQHDGALRSVLIDEGAAPATINHVLSAVRGVVKDAWRLGYVDAETRERVADVGNVTASTLPKGRHVDVGEVAALFRACGDAPVGARDAAMLALLYGCGLRRSEAVALERADYAAGAVTVRQGKGRKQRMVYLPAGGRSAVDAWIARRGDWPGPLLCPVAKGGRLLHRGITAQALMKRLRYLAAKAHVPSFTPHDLRRSFVGTLLDAGADISSVQQLAGHANANTTQQYDRRPEEAKRKTAELLHVPYSAPRLLVEDPAPAS